MKPDQPNAVTGRSGVRFSPGGLIISCKRGGLEQIKPTFINIKNISYSLPKILTYVGKIKILCAKKSDAEDNPATSSPEGKIIVFYDSAFKMDIKRVLAHELAHFLYNSLSDNEKKLYWKNLPLRILKKIFFSEILLILILRR